MRLRPDGLCRGIRLGAEHRLAKAVEHRIHDLLVRHGVSDGLAHLDVVEGRLGHVHAEVLDAVGERRRHDVELAGVAELDEILVRQLVGDVGIAPLEKRAAVARRRHHAPDHAAHGRFGAQVPRLVALEDHFGAGRPLRHLVGAAADGVLLGVFQRPRILGRRVLLHQAGVEHARHHHGDVGDGEAVLAQEVDAEGVIVHRDELLRLFERTSRHLECREAAHRDGTIEGPLHVLRGDGRAVLEFRILAQLEGDGHVADVHVLGKFHLELVAVVVLDAVRQRLHLMADEAVIAVPRHLVARHVGTATVDIDVVRAAFRHHQQRLLAVLRARRRPDGGGGDSRRGGSRRRLQKFTTFHGLRHLVFALARSA